MNIFIINRLFKYQTLATLSLFLFFNITAPAQTEYPFCQPGLGWRILGLPWGTFNISELPAANHPMLVIAGTLIIDQNTIWTQKQVKMMAGAQIIVATGVTFQISESVLEGCDYMWKGILMNGGATLIIDTNTRISDAVSAVESQGLNSLEVSDSELSHNFYGLNFHDGNNSNGFTLIDATIDGSGPLKAPYPGQPASLYGPRGKVGLLFSNMNKLELTSASQNNLVKNCEIGSWIKNNCVGGFFKINFENILWYENNVPHGTGILVENSLPNDPFGIIIAQCRLTNCETGVDASNSKFSLFTSQIYSSNTGIRVRNSLPNENTEIAVCIISGTNDGIVLGPNPNGRIHVYNTNIYEAALRGIYLTDETTAINNSQYTIERCLVRINPNQGLTPKINSNAVGIWATQLGVQGQNLNIQHNYVYLPGVSQGLNNTGIKVTDCHSIMIRKNHVIQGFPNKIMEHIGMFYENTGFGTIECNDFLDTDVGLVVSGALNTPTAIRTNQFKNHTSAGMIFNGLTRSFDITGDHIHAGNLWLYPTNATNPGAISTLSANANELMQFIVDANENQAFLPFVSGDNWFVDENANGATPTCDPYSGLVESGGPAERSSEPSGPSADALAGAAQLKIAPNPSGGDITVSWDAGGTDWTHLEIRSVTGVTVQTLTLEGEDRRSLEVNGLRPGIYFCRAINSAGRTSPVSKFVVH